MRAVRVPTSALRRRELEGWRAEGRLLAWVRFRVRVRIRVRVRLATLRHDFEYPHARVTHPLLDGLAAST
eukprot:scaffold85831_cov30-Phaeocystis_antarctica.AAC.1